MGVRLFAGVFLPVALLVCFDASALTKLRQGFATMLVTDGVSLIPRNPVTRARAGDDVYFWIQWKEPVPKSQLRCVITGPDDTDIDETQNFAEAEGEGFSVCGMETEDSDDGTYHFTQYLDGEKVGEASIHLEKEPLFGKVSLRKKWKYLMGALAAVVLGVYYVRRKMAGDKRSLKQIVWDDDKEDAAVKDAIVIGAKAGVVAMPRAAEPPKADEGAELRKLGMQFETMIAQPDKAKALEIGARYIALALKSSKQADALRVFKACVAADRRRTRRRRSPPCAASTRRIRAARSSPTSMSSPRSSWPRTSPTSTWRERSCSTCWPNTPVTTSPRKRSATSRRCRRRRERYFTRSPYLIEVMTPRSMRIVV
jgi:hypothetical protein